jgi:hypothetical protein
MRPWSGRIALALAAMALLAASVVIGGPMLAERKMRRVVAVEVKPLAPTTMSSPWSPTCASCRRCRGAWRSCGCR